MMYVMSFAAGFVLTSIYLWWVDWDVFTSTTRR
jgi:hypothetical protein